MMKGDEAYDKIKWIVIQQDPEAIAMLSENSLSEQLGISRTPIRKALIRLEQEGFISILPHQGITSRPISYEEAHQLFDLRGLIEDYLIKTSINLINTEDLEYLKKLVEKQKVALNNKDYNQYLNLDDEFHFFSYRHYQNDYMKSIVKNFKERFYHYRYRTLVKNKGLDSVKQHEEFLVLLEEGRLKEAEELLRKHLWKMEELIIKRSFQFI